MINIKLKIVNYGNKINKHNKQRLGASTRADITYFYSFYD